MVVVADHLSVSELKELYEAAEDVTSSRHIQTVNFHLRLTQFSISR